MRNGSRSEFFHVEGGLKLTRMRQSEWRRRWGVQGIVAFEEAIAVGGDDGFSRSGGAFDSTSGNMVAGVIGDIWDIWMRWDNVTIPAGATIQVANFQWVGNSTGNDGSGTKTNIYMSDEDDSAAPTTQAEHAADPRTTNFIAYDDFTTPDTTTVNVSPDFTAAVQEIVDRGGWASGQAMMVLWDDDTSTNGKRYDSETVDGTAAPILHVEYSA